MRALFMAEPKKLELREIDIPEIDEDEVLLKIEYAGICGSDMHIYHGTHSFRFPPVIVGHEVAGIVEVTGKKVTKVKVGDRVAVQPMRTCFECEWCKQDLPAHCKKRYMPGQGAWIGACVEYLNVHENLLYKLPHDVDTKLGSLCEPLAVAVHALDRINQADRQTLLIMGGGGIGHLSIIAAKDMGFGKIFVSDVVKYNLDMALSNGADEVFDVSKCNLPEEIAKKTDGGVDSILVTAGSADILPQAVKSVKRRGSISVISMPAGVQQFEFVPFIFSESAIYASLNYSNTDFKTCLSLLSSQKERFRKAMTHEFTYEQGQMAFDMMAGKKEGFIKVLLKV